MSWMGGMGWQVPRLLRLTRWTVLTAVPCALCILVVGASVWVR